MAYTRTFEGYAPPNRYDGLPFTSALIRESATETGTYSTIETIVLSPVDANPTTPATRNFTTAAATLTDGWYIIRWVDAAASTFDSDAIRYLTSTGSDSFTYNLDETVGQVRLELGDTDSDTALFSDEEIESKLASSSDVLTATAALCDSLARRFAREFDFAEDGQSFSRSQKSKQYAQLAITLRRRAAAGIANVPTTRVDGYSQTIDYDDVEETSGVGRARIGWTDPDLPL